MISKAIVKSFFKFIASIKIIRLAVALIYAPFAVKNLDDNVILQYLAVIGLVVMAAPWRCFARVKVGFCRQQTWINIIVTVVVTI
jgi:uncharacterized membrane protein YqaE (UPF0057 family)